jgi:hypothetical protein
MNGVWKCSVSVGPRVCEAKRTGVIGRLALDGGCRVMQVPSRPSGMGAKQESRAKRNCGWSIAFAKLSGSDGCERKPRVALVRGWGRSGWHGARVELQCARTQCLGRGPAAVSGSTSQPTTKWITRCLDTFCLATVSRTLVGYARPWTVTDADKNLQQRSPSSEVA